MQWRSSFKIRVFILTVVLAGSLAAVSQSGLSQPAKTAKTSQPAQAESAITSKDANGGDKKGEDKWKKKLDPWTYQVTRCSATEPPFTGKYWNNHKAGEYRCSNCGALLFESKDKFDSGSGWPSFSRALGDSVASKDDNSMGMTREEVVCKHCGAHLGHVFDDGPLPTGKRYCINSASLDFQSQQERAKKAAH